MTHYDIQILDDSVDLFLDELWNGLGSTVAVSVARQIDGQRPGLPLPDKQQAVIRTSDGVGVLAETESSLRWLFALENGYYKWLKDSEVGKVLEIIHPGRSS